MSRLLSLALLTGLIGCADKATVQVSGRVYDGPNSGVSVAGVEIQAVDTAGATIATTEADSRGTFLIDMPESTVFFLVLSKEGWVTTSFTGKAGLADVRSPDGALFLRAPEVHADAAADFADCDRGGTGTGSIDGVLRLYVGGNYEDIDEAPILENGYAWVDTAEETVLSCFLPDAEGEAGTVTGETGRFALMGLSPGVALLHLAYEEGEAAGHVDEYPVYVPEDGVVPLVPAFATLP